MVPPRSDRISRVPPYSRIYLLSTRTGLSPTMARLSRRFRFLRLGHWPGPRSLATTSGVSVDVLSSGYLDVSVHRVCFVKLCIHLTMAHDGPGFPIRKSTDQRVLAPPRGLSQRATSFIASTRQGIHQMPFLRLICESRHAQGETLRRRPTIKEQDLQSTVPRRTSADCGSNIFTMTKNIGPETSSEANLNSEAVSGAFDQRCHQSGYPGWWR